MGKMTDLMRKTWVEEEGQTLVEYALIVVLVSIVAILVLGLLGGDVASLFARLTSVFSGSPP